MKSDAVLAIVAVAAIISPVLVTFLNNRHTLKLLDRKDKVAKEEAAGYYSQHIFEEYLAAMALIIQSRGNEGRESYSRTYPIALMHANDNVADYMETIDRYIFDCEYEKASNNFSMMTYRIKEEILDNYAYQKELRIVMCELENSPFARADENGNIPLTLVWNLEPIILNIGDIRDIAYKIPTKDFVELRGLGNHQYRWPHSPSGKTLYETIVDDSRQQIKGGFYSPTQRVMFSIYGD